MTPDVLDPRPETELLVEEGLKRLPQGGRLLDLGTGSGCILISVLAEQAGRNRGRPRYFTRSACRRGERNAGALGVAGRAAFIEGGWDVRQRRGPLTLRFPTRPTFPKPDIAGLEEDVRSHDPRIALTPGGDGLAPIARSLPQCRTGLRCGGWIGFEFGAGQAGECRA